jgi:hypothetical protein
MPASHRGAAGFAHVDSEMADWLSAAGYLCRPSRVAGWRAAGLLTEPTGTGVRAGNRPGRAPVAWSDAELAGARRIALRLVTDAGRGTSAPATALRLAAEGLPIPPMTVLSAARDQLSHLARAVRGELGVLPTDALDLKGDPDAVTEVVDNYVRTRPGLQRVIERRLRGAPLHPDGADAQSVVTLLAAAALGAPPDPGDADALGLTLRTFGLHGLVEPVGGPGGPRALIEGPSAAAAALGVFSLSQLEQLLAEVRPEDVHAALRATGELGRAFAAVPASAAHHLGAAAFAQVLTDNTPMAVVLRLLCWQALQHGPAGASGMTVIIDAIRAQGWCTDPS